MDFGEGAVVLLAGAAAGAVNTVVGTGSLISFPPCSRSACHRW